MRERKILSFKDTLQISIPDLSISENEVIKNYMLKILDSTSTLESLNAYLKLKEMCEPKIFRQIMNYKIKIELTTVKFKKLPQVLNVLYNLNRYNILVYPVIVGVSEVGTTFKERLIRGKYYELYKEDSPNSIIDEYRDKKYQFLVINKAISQKNISLLQECVTFLEAHECYHWVIDYFSLTPSCNLELKKEKKNC